MSLGSPLRFLFDQVGLLTHNLLRRANIREMVRHLPPSGAELRVLDLGNSAAQLLTHRPDLRVISLKFLDSKRRIVRTANPQHRTKWAQTNPLQLFIASDSVDAVTVYSSLKDRAAFLREVLRVLRPGGRLIMIDPAQDPQLGLTELSALLTEFGFARVLTERIGRSVLCRGEKPYSQLSTVERIARTAARDDAASSFQIVDAAGLLAASRGKFVYLLVRQTPDKPAWTIQPGDTLRWQAAMVSDEADQPYLLAFSSLPKAVEFMQAAVTSNFLTGINKVAKFDKAIAPRWSTDLLINPPFDALHSSARYAVKGVMLDVDPANAVTGEE